jgi:hypothetical protein
MKFAPEQFWLVATVQNVGPDGVHPTTAGNGKYETYVLATPLNGCCVALDAANAATFGAVGEVYFFGLRWALAPPPIQLGIGEGITSL